MGLIFSPLCIVERGDRLTLKAPTPTNQTHTHKLSPNPHPQQTEWQLHQTHPDQIETRHLESSRMCERKKRHNSKSITLQTLLGNLSFFYRNTSQELRMLCHN